MPFKKLVVNAYPPRQWGIVGDPGSGKSTFAAQMNGPLLVIDADHRFQEMAQIASGDVYTVDSAGNDAERIAKELRTNMPGSGVRTIIVDSLTAIITPLVTQAVMHNDAGANKNKVAAFKPKAMAMRLLQDSITGWGVDTLFIYHTRQGLDGQARQVTSTSISAVELARLRRSLNMVLRVVAEGGKRGITVDWARRGRSGMTLWDESGHWRTMPERIESAVYDGLSQQEQEAIEKAIPTSFSGPNAAIAWGFEQGCFRDAVHAANAYEEVKRLQEPQTAAAMWTLWIAEVAGRCNAADAPQPESSDFGALPQGVEQSDVGAKWQTPKDEDPASMWEPTASTATPPGHAKVKTISQAQRSRLDRLGRQAYGEEWSTQSALLVREISNNAVSAMGQLLPDEAEALIRDIEKRLTKLGGEVQATGAKVHA